MKRLLLVLFVVAAGFAALSGYVAASRERQYRALIAAGDAAMAREDTFVAVEAFSGAIALRQESMLPYLKRGQAYYRRGELQNAQRDLRRAMELDPTATRVLEALGDVTYALRDYEHAAGRYAECVIESKRLYDDPTFTSPWRALTNWGWASYRLGNVEEGREHLRTSREYNARYWPTHLNLGILEAEQGNRSAAIESFERVLELAQEPSAIAEASYRIAEIYVAQGRREEAMGHLRAAVGKAPSDLWGKKSEAYLRQLR